MPTAARAYKPVTTAALNRRCVPVMDTVSGRNGTKRCAASTTGRYMQPYPSSRPKLNPAVRFHGLTSGKNRKSGARLRKATKRMRYDPETSTNRAARIKFNLRYLSTLCIAESLAGNVKCRQWRGNSPKVPEVLVLRCLG